MGQNYNYFFIFIFAKPKRLICTLSYSDGLNFCHMSHVAVNSKHFQMIFWPILCSHSKGFSSAHAPTLVQKPNQHTINRAFLFWCHNDAVKSTLFYYSEYYIFFVMKEKESNLTKKSIERLYFQVFLTTCGRTVKELTGLLHRPCMKMTSAC